MPRLVVIGVKPELLGILYQPLINWCIHLHRPICVTGIDRISSDIYVKCSARKVGAINGKPRPSGIWCFTPQLFLIFAGSK
jgi:hypothetical protein